MPTVTKTFAFATTAEGWTATTVSGSPSNTYDAANGNPPGSLLNQVTGIGASATAYWEWSGTWQSLGVPAGNVVTHVRLDAIHNKSERNFASSLTTIGQTTLRSSAGAALATLHNGRAVPSGSDADWVTDSGSNVAVPAGHQASGSSIRLRVQNALRTGANTGAFHRVYTDQLAFVVTYQAASVELAGSAAGAAGASAARLTIGARLAGSAAGVGLAASDHLATGARLAAELAGAAGASAVRLRLAHPLAGSADGAASAAASRLRVAHALGGEAAGVGLAADARLKIEIGDIGGRLGVAPGLTGRLGDGEGQGLAARLGVAPGVTGRIG